MARILEHVWFLSMVFLSTFFLQIKDALISHKPDVTRYGSNPQAPQTNVSVMQGLRLGTAWILSPDGTQWSLGCALWTICTLSQGSHFGDWLLSSDGHYGDRRRVSLEPNTGTLRFDTVTTGGNICFETKHSSRTDTTRLTSGCFGSCDQGEWAGIVNSPLSSDAGCNSTLVPLNSQWLLGNFLNSTQALRLSI